MKRFYLLKLMLLTSIFSGLTWNVSAQTSTYIYTGTIGSYTVPAAVTSISIAASGAQGGDGLSTGGFGANMTGTFTVVPGHVLNILVGQQPPGTLYCAGGGGGSFVWDVTAGNTLLMAAGGGGGGGYGGVAIGQNASLTTSGTNGGGGAAYGGAGSAGNGGVVPSFSEYGAGGCGWLTNGAGGLGLCSNATGGATPLTGGAGGTYGGTIGYDGDGGFGGGGGGQGQCNATGAGGGGGYSGGGGGAGSPFPGGGGGGSFCGGTLTTSSATNTGNGQVVISVLCTTPIAGTIAGPSDVCEGANVTLSDPTGTTGGVWSSTNPSAATIDPTTGVVTGLAAGTTTISYSITLSCGSAVATTSLTVDPVPAAITGPLNVCVSSSVTLSDGTTGGTWSSVPTAVAMVGASTGIVNGMSAGTATISYSLPSGCSSSVVMSVNMPPAPITGPTSVCMGSTITVGDLATGGNWSSTNASVATIGTGAGVVTPVSPGTTLITYANGCGAPATVSVSVNPLPLGITGITNVCLGDTTVLHDTTIGGTWSSALTTIATVGASTGVVTGVTPGSTTIYYTLATGCFASVTSTVIPPLSPITGSNNVCVGSTTLLGASPAGGTWLTDNAAVASVNAATGVVSGRSIGTVVITYTAGAGCSATLDMTVNPLAPIVGADSVCSGLSTFLTDIVGGGTWRSSNPSIATADIDSGRISGVVPGSVIITYTIVATGCQSSVAFSVIAFPDAISGTTKACPGISTALSDLVPTGGVWSSSNASVATVGSSNGVVTGVNADTVSISYSILPGCAVNTVVTINPLPEPITGNLIICPGTVDSLQDISTGGLWSSSTPSLATVVDTSGAVYAIAGGSAIIEYTLPTGCFRTKTISINPVPIPVVTYDALTNTFFAAISPAWVNYQWYDSIQGLIPGATSPTLAALYNEYYYVVVTDTNGCKGASPLIHFNVTETGIKNALNGTPIKVYPNPASGMVHIEAAIRLRAVISSVEGKKIIEQADAKEIDVSKLADGTYLIGLYDDRGALLSVQKLTKN